jgi:hypothetical protein
MNIFYLHNDPVTAAEYHVDKHVVKMVQEYAQLLSTAHRVLDGRLHGESLAPGVHRNLITLGVRVRPEFKAQILPGEAIVFDFSANEWVIANKKAMMMTHVNHPSAIWVRQSAANYSWLYSLFEALSHEKKFRYPKGPNRTYFEFREFLKNPPANIPVGRFTEPTPAMPPFYKIKKADGTYDSIASYRRFYIGDKYRFARWTSRSIPKWYLDGLVDAWSDDPDERLRVLLKPKVAKKTQITPAHIQKVMTDVYNRVVV